ncbi:MAG TPA: YtcA family lipoprotein [Paraburkholderia sp.]|nr:YtcA family lipoprotein [Paraburkholderia sp.]
MHRRVEAECVGKAAKRDIDPNDTTTLERHMRFVRDEGPKRAAGVTAAIAAAFVSGCSGSPSISVLGAYFPDWLFCIVAGVVLTVVIYLILKRLQADHFLWPSAVLVPTLVTFFSLAVWLMLFQH